MSPPSTPVHSGSAITSASYPFGPASVWRQRVDSAPLAADSEAAVAYLDQSVVSRYGGVAALNVHQYGNSFYVAPRGTPRVDVAFDDCQGKGGTPPGLTGPAGQFSGVPIPAGVVPPAGTDKQTTVYSPSTDQLWEFWVLEPTGPSSWKACWGGRIDHVSRSPGWFAGGFGASASGLSCAGGTIFLDDVRRGSIDHALSLAVTDPAIWSRVSWPAQRSDGWDTDPRALPEGTRLRLDPRINVSALRLHPLAAMVARAAQVYGFIVTDQAGAVALTAESGAAEQATTGRDPWAAVLGNTPDYSVLAGFPWDRLQVLPQDYGRP